MRSTGPSACSGARPAGGAGGEDQQQAVAAGRRPAARAPPGWRGRRRERRRSAGPSARPRPAAPPSRPAARRPPGPAWPGPGPAAGPRPSRRGRARAPSRGTVPWSMPSRSMRCCSSRAAPSVGGASGPIPAACASSVRNTRWALVRRARCRRSPARVACSDAASAATAEARRVLPIPRSPTSATAAPCAGLHRAPRPLQALALARPPDQGCPPAAADPAVRLTFRRHLVHRHRGAVLEDDVLAGLDLEAVADQPQHLAAHHQGPGPGRLVELGGQVRGVPEGEGRVVPDGGDQHLAGVGGDAHRQRLAGLGLQPGRQAAQHHQQVEAGTNGPGGVVLARHRVAEPHVDPVALVLGDLAAVAFHHRRARIVVGAEDGEVGLNVPLARTGASTRPRRRT